ARRVSTLPLYRSLILSPFFFFSDTAATVIDTLSLHDALPISVSMRKRRFFAPLTSTFHVDCSSVRASSTTVSPWASRLIARWSASLMASGYMMASFVYSWLANSTARFESLSSIWIERESLLYPNCRRWDSGLWLSGSKRGASGNSGSPHRTIGRQE